MTGISGKVVAGIVATLLFAYPLYLFEKAQGSIPISLTIWFVVTVMLQIYGAVEIVEKGKRKKKIEDEEKEPTKEAS